MKKIGGKQGPKITTYDNSDSTKQTTYSFFYFFNGQIQMTITTETNKVIFDFTSLEDFKANATSKGLPSELIGTVASQY